MVPDFIDCPAPLGGYWWEDDETVCLPVISSNGHPREMLNFLAMLEAKGRRVFIPTVINARLAKLLELRGYRYSETVVFDDVMKEWIDGYTKG